MPGTFSDYARLLRLPGLGGLSIAPVFGAISVGIFDIEKLGILFLIGAFTAIYGFVLNDYADVEIDKLSRALSSRPLVKGTVKRKTALSICYICFIAAFATIFLGFYDNHIYISFYLGITCILLSAILGTIYNLYGKRIVGSDFLVALSEALLVLFGAFIVLKDGALTIFTWIIFLLTFNQLVYMNAVEGGLKDADHDPKMKVKNIALSSGVRVTKGRRLIIPTGFKVFGLGIRLFSAFLVFVPFFFYSKPYELGQIILLLLLVCSVLILSEKLLTLKMFHRNKIRKLITGQTFLRYSLVPIMLITETGAIIAVILIFFPFIWYLVFTPLIGEKLFRPGL